MKTLILTEIYVDEDVSNLGYRVELFGEGEYWQRHYVLALDMTTKCVVQKWGFWAIFLASYKT